MKSNPKKSFKTKVIFAFILVTTFLMSISGFAQWSANPYQNNPICTDPDTQAKPVIAPDGSGGAIIAWNDQRGGGSTIYAQRIDANGVLKWTSDGIVVCSAMYFRGYPVIVSDGSGGAIIAWPDYRNGIDFDIYAQRVDGNGVMQWASDGIGVCTGQGDQNFPVIISDGNNGAILTWIDDRSLNTMNPDIYAQGINADGSLKWSQTIGISTNTDGVTNPAIATDGSGGAIITWSEDMSLHNDTSAADIYVQHLANNGTTLWTTDGVSICAAKRLQVNPVITSDGNGGAFIAWVDERNVNNTFPYNSDIFAQHVNSSGVAQWQPDGIGISTTTEQQFGVKIISDQAGGAILAFLNWSGFVNTLITQRINISGSFLWGGYPIGSGGKGAFDLVSDNNDGALLTWEDSRSGAVDNYAQHLDASGAEVWLLGGVLVSNAFGSQANPRLVNDISGGIIIVWDDSRNTNLDIYAQHVKADGTLGGSSVSVGELSAITRLVSVYPNPVDQELYVDVSYINSYSPVEVSIIDVSGKTLESIIGNGIVRLNMGKYKSSVYLIQTRVGEQVVRNLIIKK